MVLDKKVKIYTVIVSLCFLLLVILIGLYREHNSCMGISLISYSELESYKEDLTVDIKDITFNEESVIADIYRGTIYISQASDLIKDSSKLQGKLDIKNPEQKLYILNNAQLQNLKETISNGEYLTLVVVQNNSICKFNVAISTLPVISIDGENYIGYTKKAAFICESDMTLLAGQDPSIDKPSKGNYSIKWHIRGGKSARLAKKPIKITLLKENGKNKNVDLLGMGADDDWILNPMNLDDTKLREKSAIEVWNNYITDPVNDYSMSTAQYVELVVNGNYYGLYLLQRRVDAKFLELDKTEDLLFKGHSGWGANYVWEGYGTVYSPFEFEETYGLLEDAIYKVDIENYVNVNLFLQFLSATDNVGYKNMFYALKPDENGEYKLYHIPWDTDVSMGIIPGNGYLNYYDFKICLGQDIRRMDYYNMLLEYSDLDNRMAERWRELSGTVFGEGGKYEEILDANKKIILESGALARDTNHWGLMYNGGDTIENLYLWNKEKTLWMDELWK